MPPKQPTKLTTGLRPKSTKPTENGKDGTKTPKEEVDSREQTLERENMMLRKNLDMPEIMKVFHKTVTENHMQAMFFETLHDLELKIQKYESSTGLTTRGSLSDLQIDLDRERANSKTLDKQVKEKNRMIDDYRKSLNEKDKELKAYGTELELQRSHNRHSSEAIDKLQKLQLEYDDIRNNMAGKESVITSLSKEVENLKNELAKAEKINTTLKEDVAEIETLRTELNGYSKEHQERITEIKDLTRKLKQRDMMFKENEALLHQQQKTLEERNNVIERLNAENTHDPAENEEKDKELSNLRNTLDEQTELLKSLKEDKQKLLQEKTEIEIELSKLSETLNQKEYTIAELESRLNSPTKNRSEEDCSVIDQTDELNRLTNELKEAKAANAKVTREKEKLEFTCHEAFDKLEKTEKRIKQQQDEHNKAIKRKDEIIQKLRAEKLMVDPTGGGNANIETKSLVEKYEKTVKELTNARNEIEELKQRILKIPGGSLVNGSQSISDLTGDNRPAKLSEKFSELYENEWTVAYKEAATEFNSDEKIIGHLYKTVIDIFDFCKTIAEEHEKSIQACALTVPYAARGRLKTDKIGLSNLRQMKELRKLVAPHLVEGVFQHFLDTMQINLMGKRTTEKFMKKCVEVCWLMNSQDPPVTIDTTYSKGAEFDGDRFRSYTKSGKLIDYVVWPPVMLHKDGQLLCKGVAQAR